MDDALVLKTKKRTKHLMQVLILVVMDDALVHNGENWYTCHYVS